MCSLQQQLETFLTPLHHWENVGIHSTTNHLLNSTCHIMVIMTASCNDGEKSFQPNKTLFSSMYFLEQLAINRFSNTAPVPLFLLGYIKWNTFCLSICSSSHSEANFCSQIDDFNKCTKFSSIINGSKHLAQRSTWLFQVPGLRNCNIRTCM